LSVNLINTSRTRIKIHFFGLRWAAFSSNVYLVNKKIFAQDISNENKRKCYFVGRWIFDRKSEKYSEIVHENVRAISLKPKSFSLKILSCAIFTFQSFVVFITTNESFCDDVCIFLRALITVEICINGNFMFARSMIWILLPILLISLASIMKLH
jgi:hypothetical protein